MRRSLNAAGFVVFDAENAAEAIQRFEMHRDEIDMLVTDISLPGRNGVELAQALLRRRSQLKVLFVSGHVGAEVIRFYGFAATDQHFLKKPFRDQEFVARVREILSSKESLPWPHDDTSREESEAKDSSIGRRDG